MIDCNEWRTEKRHECANMGKVKRLELWWQLYRTSLPFRDLENFRPMEFCWTECTFMIMSDSIRLRKGNFWNNSCRDNQHTLCVQYPILNLTVYEIIWKNVVQPDRPQTTIWRMRVACWIPKATNILSQFVILIAFPQHQWLHTKVLQWNVIRTAHCLSCL